MDKSVDESSVYTFGLEHTKNIIVVDSYKTFDTKI